MLDKTTNVSWLAFATILCLSAGMRGFLIYKVQPWNEEVVKDRILLDDARGYHDLACGILEQRTFRGFGVFRTPAYPVFLAGVYSLFGTKVWPAIIIQAVLDIGTTALVFWIAKEIFFSQLSAVIAGLFYSLNFSSAYYCTRIMSETLFTFIFALSILLLTIAMQRNRVIFFVISGLFLGIAILIRPIAQYFVVVPALVILLHKRKATTALLWILAIAIPSFAVLVPWQLRNYVRYGHYALANTKGIALFDGSVNLKRATENISTDEARDQLLGISNEIKGSNKTNVTAANRMNLTYSEARAQLMGAPENAGYDVFEEADIWGRIAIEYMMERIKSHPLGCLRSYSRSLAHFFFAIGRPGHREVFKRLGGLFVVVSLVVLCGQYVCCLVGAIWTWWNKHYLPYLILMAMSFLYFAGIIGLIGDSRYRVPGMPFFLILSAVGCERIYRFCRQKVAEKISK